ncbi:MAG TPA: NHL repeat-containing protein [Thermoanaerobaculia bacterium]|jgi:sugar lactone lactonase YvrE|nr:NHL repeat-containing protein [Thermoanaerobaculia bacterium]
MNLRCLVLSLSLILSSAVQLHAAEEAVRELGQPSFRGFMPNRLDARGLSQPWGVAVDTSRTPDGLWVVDARNNRVLGWRDVTALRNGAPADVVLGQPNARTNGCNYGGISASSLCFVESPHSFAYEPGVAVDGEGNLYVADQLNRRVLGYRRPFETDRVADVVIGQAGFDQAEYTLTPYGLAADAQGNLYIGEDLRVFGLDRPLATDAIPDRVFGQPRLDARDFPTDPTAPDRIVLPKGIAVDGQGRLYVADAYMDRVMVWTRPLVRQGAADLIFSQGGKPCNGSCSNVKGLAVTPGGDVWVGSHEQGKIFGYRSPLSGGDTQPDRVIAAVNSAAVYDPKPPLSAQPMFASGGLAIDSRGVLWVADVNRVLGFLDPWRGNGGNGGNGRADLLVGQVRADQIEANLVDLDGFNGPGGIAIDTHANPPHLYVLDVLNNRVLGWADARSFTNGQPADLVLGQPDRWASRCNTGGRSLASLCLFGDYIGIAVDAKGTVWVADPGNQRVLGYFSPFTTDTVADRELGGIGCAHGLRGMCSPGGVAVDKAGNVYVADIINNRILEFNEPARRDAVADRVIVGGDGATEFSEPNDNHPGYNVYGGPLAIDAAGRLLVGNGGNVYVFERPLSPGARSRKLIDISAIRRDYYFTPYGLATDSESRIYLTTRDHVYRFPRNGGSPSLQLGETCTIGYSTGVPEGLVRASLCDATGVAVSQRGEIFVSDAGANRVLVFDPP